MFLKRNVFLLFFLLISCGFGFAQKTQPIKGITVVAPPQAFESDPFEEIKALNANWIALVPYGFSRNNDSEVLFNLDRQWWGEKEEGIRECIRLAKKHELKVMLKPQVYIHNSWVGEFKCADEPSWKKWEKSYQNYILSYARIAEETGVEMLCIGTEYRIAVKKRKAFWKTLIKKIKEIYSGKLTYSANWDDYNNVTFWDQLDYIGISGYFPFKDENATKSDLLNAWKKTKKELLNFSLFKQKQILFTEYGYLSVDGCYGKTWELEKKINQLAINESDQAMALDALYTTFWEESFWSGGFLWKWFPEMKGHEGYPERDYTPQGKKAQKTISTWFSKDTNHNE